MSDNNNRRPKIEIDLDQIKKLCQLHCTGEEIAGYFEVDYDTLIARIREGGYNNFSEFFSRFSAKGKISLRRKQFELAMQGSVAMLSKLGDNWLGQYEKVERVERKVDIEPETLEQYDARMAEIKRYNEYKRREDEKTTAVSPSKQPQ